MSSVDKIQVEFIEEDRPTEEYIFNYIVTDRIPNVPCRNLNFYAGKTI